MKAAVLASGTAAMMSSVVRMFARAAPVAASSAGSSSGAVQCMRYERSGFAAGVRVGARTLTKRAPSSRERSPYVAPRGQQTKSAAPSALELKREMEEKAAAKAAAHELEGQEWSGMEKERGTGNVASDAMRQRRRDVRAFYLELVLRLESGQQLGCTDVKQFLLSCGRPESNAASDSGAGIDGDAETDAEGMREHAKMALSLLRRLRLQRCHYQIFTPFPAETSSLFIRACIRSGDALIALRAVEMYDDLGLQLCGHACNELMEALGGTRAGDGGRGDGLNPLRLMYRLLDVMCRAGLQPSPRTAHVMCSAVLNGSTAAEPGSGATAAATVLKEFEANGVVVSQESWDAVEHAGYLRDTTTTASTL